MGSVRFANFSATLVQPVLHLSLVTEKSQHFLLPTFPLRAQLDLWGVVCNLDVAPPLSVS